jgi:Ca2+-binding RTX toxin-like protein
VVENFAGNVNTPDNAAAVTPFADVTITDGSAAVTATLTFDNTKGALGNLGIGQLNGGTYTVTGTATAVQNAIRGLTFNPNDNANGEVGTSVVTTFGLSVTDSGNLTTTPGTNVTVTSTVANRAPTITAAARNVDIQHDENANLVSPFANVSFADTNAGDEITVTLSGFAGKGALSNFTNTGAEATVSVDGGTYTITGTAAEVQEFVRALKYDPRDRVGATTTEKTTFSLTIKDDHNLNGAANNSIEVDSTPTVVVPPPQNRAPSVTGFSAGALSEYAAVGTFVGTLSGQDPDGDGITYSLVGGAADLFSIDGNRVVLKAAVNYEVAPSHTITVVATDSKGLASTAQTFTITVGDEVTLTKRGTNRNDKINGSNLDDNLFGGKGNDQLKGLGGDDKLYGEVGNDKLYGGDGLDRLSGGKGNDLLKGDAGNDRLYGDEGNDQLYGGAGQDVFVFTKKLSKTGNLDWIRDFKVADDTIWLENRIFSKLGSAGSEAAPAALNKDFFKVGSKAKDRNDYIVYDNKKGILYYDADGSGKRAAVEITKLAKNLKLTADDFFVI